LASLPPGASPPLPSPRAPSPFGALNPTSKPHQLKKKQNNGSAAPGHALGLLRSLDPADNILQRRRSKSEDRDRVRVVGDHDKKDKKAFWSWDKDKKSTDEGADDLTKMIGAYGQVCSLKIKLTEVLGFLTSTSSEDWAFTLDVCERASSNEQNAKEAVRALRREFKYVIMTVLCAFVLILFSSQVWPTTGSIGSR